MSERTTTLIPLLVAAALLAPRASAQAGTQTGATTPPDAPLDYEAGLTLADVVVDGDGWQGRIVSVEHDEATVRLVGRPSSRARVPLEAIDPETRYVIRRIRMDDTRADAWTALAAFAERHDLLVRQVEALQHARRLVEDPERRAELGRAIDNARARIARDRLEHAKSLREDDDLDDAIHVLETVVAEYPAVEAADEAKRLLDDLESRAASGTTPAPDHEAKGPRDELVAEVEKHIESGNASLTDGLKKLGDHVDSTEAFESALESFREARELVRTAQDEGQGRAAHSDRIRRLKDRIESKLARAHLELGHVSLARGDEESAYEHAGEAATLDPSDPGVAALRRAIGSRDG